MQETRLNTREFLRARGICVIIPTYNNAATVAGVVARAQEQCEDVIVVCDGCTDDTVQRLQALPDVPEMIVLEKNQGKGAALKKGFRYALKKGFSYAVTLDADGQHFPEDIPALLQANMKNPGALIVGRRKNLQDADRSGGSKFANRFSNFWFCVQTGRYLPDTQTGYRLYPLKKLYGLNLLTSRYEAELELLVFASWNGVRVVSAEVNVHYPPRGQRVSHFHPFKDFARITVLNCVLCLLAVVYALPLAVLRSVFTACRSAYSVCFVVFFVMLVATPAFFLYFSIGGETSKKKDNLHRITNWMARFVLYRHGVPGIRYSQVNHTGEDFSVPSVIICNHQSHLDLLPILALTPKVIVLTADWVWKNPLYGYLIRKAGFLPVSSGIDVIMPHVKECVERGYSIVVYPEGTRSEDGSIGRFHKGAFYLAENLGLDIVPVVLYGTGKALPKHGRYLRKWPVHMEICRRIRYRAFSQDGKTTLERASATRNFYREKYVELSNRMERDV